MTASAGEAPAPPAPSQPSTVASDGPGPIASSIGGLSAWLAVEALLNDGDVELARAKVRRVIGELRALEAPAAAIVDLGVERAKRGG